MLSFLQSTIPCVTLDLLASAMGYTTSSHSALSTRPNVSNVVSEFRLGLMATHHEIIVYLSPILGLLLGPRRSIRVSCTSFLWRWRSTTRRCIPSHFLLSILASTRRCIDNERVVVNVDITGSIDVEDCTIGSTWTLRSQSIRCLHVLCTISTPAIGAGSIMDIRHNVDYLVLFKLRYHTLRMWSQVLLLLMCVLGKRVRTEIIQILLGKVPRMVAMVKDVSVVVLQLRGALPPSHLSLSIHGWQQVLLRWMQVFGTIILRNIRVLAWFAVDVTYNHFAGLLSGVLDRWVDLFEGYLAVQGVLLASGLWVLVVAWLSLSDGEGVHSCVPRISRDVLVVGELRVGSAWSVWLQLILWCMVLVTLVDDTWLIVTIQGVSSDTSTYFESIRNLLLLALLVVLIHEVGELRIGLV